MAEYFANLQTVNIGSPINFNASIPCRKGYVYHEDGTGIFTLRGAVSNPSCCFARYQVVFNGNIAVPTGTVGAIAVAIAVSGEPRLTSRAIVTPAAVNEYNNVTSTAIITVPKGCCFNVSIDAVNASPDATTTAISVQDGNLTITRIA